MTKIALTAAAGRKDLESIRQQLALSPCLTVVFSKHGLRLSPAASPFGSLV
ncbi:hypothetical protein [Mesorhizobium sp. M0802]|uniref:hypothetical protein n=1 Tax=Mesorhizobium sp. M0802 TaxID=2957001 RepID=UPI00333606B7